MWNWFNCYLSGRHDYGIWSEPGAIFLRCVHCGRRSPGWMLDPKPASAAELAKTPTVLATNVVELKSSGQLARILPFGRAVS